MTPYLKKKLLYQSKNRGCKETDLLLGKFADQFLDKMIDAELQDYERILAQTDADIVDWVMRKAEVPVTLKSNVMKRVLEFSLVSE